MNYDYKLDPPDPGPDTEIDCRNCHGMGFEPEACECEHCEGTGQCNCEKCYEETREAAEGEAADAKYDEAMEGK